MKNKGKVHPSPSTPNTNSNNNNHNNNKDINSVLNLLPATIFTLLSLLSLEDREVLAYLITVSLKTTRPTPSATAFSSSTTTTSSSYISKTTSNIKKSKNNLPHRESPVFNCDCFDCYTSYWTKWDSSPNRELIHQALEVFEEQHHAFGFNYAEGSDIYLQKQARKNGNSRSTRSSSKKKDKKAASLKLGMPETSVSAPESGHSAAVAAEVVCGGCDGGGSRGSLSAGGELVVPVNLMEKMMVDEEEVPVTVDVDVEVEVVETPSAAEVGGSNRRGLARKMLPDVWGFLNYRLWGIWIPNV